MGFLDPTPKCWHSLMAGLGEARHSCIESTKLSLVACICESVMIDEACHHLSRLYMSECDGVR